MFVLVLLRGPMHLELLLKLLEHLELLLRGPMHLELLLELLEHYSSSSSTLSYSSVAHAPRAPLHAYMHVHVQATVSISHPHLLFSPLQVAPVVGRLLRLD